MYRTAYFEKYYVSGYEIKNVLMLSFKKIIINVILILDVFFPIKYNY